MASFPSFFRLVFALSERLLVNIWWNAWDQLEFLSNKFCAETSAKGKPTDISSSFWNSETFSRNFLYTGSASKFFWFFGHWNSSSVFSWQIMHSFQFVFIQLTFLLNTSRNNTETCSCIQSAYSNFSDERGAFVQRVPI